MRVIILIGISFGVLLFSVCKNEPETLPYLGRKEVHNGDSVYHVVPDTRLIDQDSNDLRISQLENKVYIADFFFTSCPSICPKVTKQMLRIYDKYKDDDRVVLISHTIDQRHDSVSVLHRYAQNLGVDTDRWKFVTGEKDSIFNLADQYFVSVVEDPSAPMGFDHSGRIILLDKERHVRGFCEGTDPESVTAFMETVDLLLDEQYP
ncbi:MAG: SCO family protein [Saprospiraceae bacterium]